MPAQITPAQFIAKWSPVELSERAASHEHFIDLCRMLGQPTPAEHDATGAEYTFEKGVTVTGPASIGAGGDRGFADVWWRGKFAWEYKRRGKYRDLTEAYRQLCQYREALENPPLLIVSDIARTEIHTNFTGTAKVVHTIALADFDKPEPLDLLRRVFSDPESFKPTVTREAVTKDIAERFSTIARSLREFGGHDAHTVAHYLMKCMFCLFAEDVDLLPASLFSKVVEAFRNDPAKLADRLTRLFDAMRTGGEFGADEVKHFNGGLFDDAPALRMTAADIETLRRAATADWGSVEPAIFGTLFERSLDPNTRAQIGAHYTSRDDIMLVVEPVVMAPLRREWEAVKADVEAQIERRRAATAKATKSKADKQIEKTLRDFVQRLASIRVLDPACGSGNFLYVAIQQLLALEKEVITYAARPEIALGLFPQVRPTQLFGIEINPYAAELAQVVIWIGYLQWMRDNGYIDGIRTPILEPLQTIECRDAILEFPPEPRHSCREESEPRHSCREESEPVRSHRHDSPARREWRGSGNPSSSGGRGGTYLLTWTAYGTWLPGDERGFVGRVPDRKGGYVIHNIPEEPYDADDPRFRIDAKRKIKGTPVRLTRDHAETCVEAFREVCRNYGFAIHAAAVIANHVHVVVDSPEAEGARLLNLFKGVSSRRLGQRFGKQPSQSWWTTGGSRRLLPDGRAIEDAVNYVRNQEYILAALEFPNPDIHARPIPGIDTRPSPGIHAGRNPQTETYAGRDASEQTGGVSTNPPDMNAGARTDPPGMNGGARARPAHWPEADFIIGNPPFLGGNLVRQGLGDDYVEALFAAYDIPKFSDLCCYWFELARRAIERCKRTRAGLLATQGIRGGVNREVLTRIKKNGEIFLAWSDREWILDGAAVHVAIIGFATDAKYGRVLDGRNVASINADLTTGLDLTRTFEMAQNLGIQHEGDKKGGAFELGYDEASAILRSPVVCRDSIVTVCRPWFNGSEINGRLAGNWIVDFPPGTPLAQASQFPEPFRIAKERVGIVYEKSRKAWWIHERARPAMRAAIESLSRYPVTVRHAKYRIFTWVRGEYLPDSAVIVFARSDDYFFGVLHSAIHELWALRMGTQLEDRPRYTPTTCFETFPLPWSPGKEPCPTPGIDTRPNPGIHTRPSPGIDTRPSPGIHAGRDALDPIGGVLMNPPAINGGARTGGDRIYERISNAAKELNEQRERWLNPPEWIEPIAKELDREDDFADVPAEARELIRHSAIMARAAKDANLKKRTLTNLYNERPTWLKLAHEKLDRAVLAAYAATDPEGDWSEDWAEVWLDTGAGFPLPDDHPHSARRKETDQLVLANLLRLNLARAESE